MQFIYIIKTIILGIVQGITEWLPISSTGHMILVDKVLQHNMSKAFKEMFYVVIQFGSIMAVVALYWRRLITFSFKEKLIINNDTMSLWLKILAACVPAAIIGLLFDDKIYALLYNYQTVAGTLILYGILFIIIESRNSNKAPKDDRCISSIGISSWYIPLGSNYPRCNTNRYIKNGCSRVYKL